MSVFAKLDVSVAPVMTDETSDEPLDIHLRMEGFPQGVCELNREAIQVLSMHRVGPLPIVCFTGRAVRPERLYEGWRLRDVLELGGISALERMRLKQSLILCHAQDGYRAIFTWHELFNSPLGDGALVCPEPRDQLTLVSAGDLRAGPRNLQRLQRLQWMELPA